MMDECSDNTQSCNAYPRVPCRGYRSCGERIQSAAARATASVPPGRASGAYILLEHALLMVKQKKKMKQYKVYRLTPQFTYRHVLWSIVAHHLTPSRSVPSTNVRKMNLPFWYFGAAASIAMARKVVLTACHHTKTSFE